MKVIFIDNGVYALLNFRKDIIQSFIDEGWDVTVVLTASDLKTESIKRIPNKCKVYGPDMAANGMNPFKDLKYVRQLISIFKKEKPDIVLTYTAKPNIYGATACRICHVPCIAMMPGLGFLFEGSGLTKKLGRMLYKFAMKMASKVIVLNKSNYDMLVSIGFVDQTKLVWLKGGEGVDLKKYKSKKKNYDTVRFLMIARLLYDKGYQEYIDAARIVKEKYPNIVIEILGGTAFTSPMGVPEKTLESDIHDGNVKYLGVTNDVPSFINRNGTVMVIPSKYLEGLNRSLMEACAAGCPIITTDIPGCRETVIEGVNGYLIPKGDSEKLAEAMIKMIELTPEQRERMSSESQKLAEAKFDVRHVIDRMKGLVSEVLE